MAVAAWPWPGEEGEAEMEAGLKRREGRAERQRSKVGQVILAAKSGMAWRKVRVSRHIVSRPLMGRGKVEARGEG